MCGIVGYYDPGARIDSRNLAAACEAIRHRGPDASNVFVSGPVGLGHRRLKIIDLSDDANQPMATPDGQVILVFNGEIYNYRELQRELIERGHAFRTSGDTEVLLHMYLEYGEDCLKRLRGMFAFGLWDKRQNKFFIARDRLGIKPLYYRLKDGAFCFASEIKALLALDTAAEIDRQALHDYLTFRYTISPRTMFRGIQKLPPGYSLEYVAGKIQVRKYWELDFEKSNGVPHDDWPGLFRQQFTEALRYHLVSDVPVGILLSGGLDSSVVTAVAQAE